MRPAVGIPSPRLHAGVTTAGDVREDQELPPEMLRENACVQAGPLRPSVDRHRSLRWPASSAIKVALPRIEEQNTVSGILADMDAEVLELEAKLMKARQIKQGMMQELLTGRIRLI